MYWATADRPHWSLSRRAAHDGATFLYPSIHLSTGRRAGWRGRNRVIRRADSFQCARVALDRPLISVRPSPKSPRHNCSSNDFAGSPGDERGIPRRHTIPGRLAPPGASALRPDGNN
jgi:hypothetical protein